VGGTGLEPVACRW